MGCLIISGPLIRTRTHSLTLPLMAGRAAGGQRVAKARACLQARVHAGSGPYPARGGPDAGKYAPDGDSDSASYCVFPGASQMLSSPTRARDTPTDASSHAAIPALRDGEGELADPAAAPTQTNTLRVSQPDARRGRGSGSKESGQGHNDLSATSHASRRHFPEVFHEPATHKPAAARALRSTLSAREGRSERREPREAASERVRWGPAPPSQNPTPLFASMPGFEGIVARQLARGRTGGERRLLQSARLARSEEWRRDVAALG
jgi:hypothetical protein